LFPLPLNSVAKFIKLSSIKGKDLVLVAASTISSPAKAQPKAKKVVCFRMLLRSLS
jgi:amino acid permease